MSGNTAKYGNFLLAPLAASIIAAAGAATAAVPDAVYAPNSGLNISPGSDSSQLNFSWATKHADSTPKVQIVNSSGSDTTTFPGVTAQAYLTASAGTVAAGWYQNKVTVKGLAPSSSYKYRVGYDTVWSGFYTFQTRNPGSAISIIAVGDPQIGASTTGADSIGWQSTIAAAMQMVPNAGFLLSVGDQINNTTTQSGVDSEYDAYFSPPLLSLPVVTTDGNHDYGLGQYFGYHYNFANQSTEDGVTSYGNDGDYWFSYGNSLFMVLNSNNESAATHQVFIGQAIADNPNAKWKILVFHHSLYSDATHATDADVVFRRTAYPPFIDQYNIDVVLSGHDHSYTRSYQMLGGMPVSRPGDSVMAVNPQGTLYMTLNSGSGSKYYQLNSTFTVNGVTAYPVYSKLFWQQNEPTFSRITIKSDTFSIVTYATNNLTKPIDSYTIVKNGLSPVIRTINKMKIGSSLKARIVRGSLIVDGLEGPARLEILNASGEKVLDLGRRVFNGSSQEITLAVSLPSGVYLLRITGSRIANVRLVQP